MTLELLESTELDFIDFWCIYSGGSRIFLEMGLVYIKVLGLFFWFNSFFLNILWKWNNLALLRSNYFIFIGYLKTGGGFEKTPWTPFVSATDLTLH